MNDELLIAGCIANNRESQHELFQKNAGKFKTVCLRYMGDEMEAEDVLLEGFHKIFKSISSYKGDGSFDGWMRRIIVNTALNKIRKKKLDRLQYVEEYQNSEVFETEPLAEMEAQYLLKMVSELPIGYRTVFNMYAIDGFSHKEIAAELGIDQGTSRSQLAKARSVLQKRLANAGFSMN